MMEIRQEVQICALFALAICTAASAIQSQVYHLTGSRFITSYEQVSSVPSALACFVTCSLHSSLRSCSYSRESRQCFVNVQAGSEEDAIARDVRVYVPKPSPPPACDRTQVVPPTKGSVTWGPSGREGEVVCNNDYIYSTDNTTITCDDAGNWTAVGSCRQRIWRNPLKNQTDFSCPRPLQVNWRMCIRGVTCSSYCRLSLDLHESSARIPFHLGARLDSQTLSLVAMAYNLYGSWQNMQVTYSFPFARGRPFAIDMRVLSMYQIQLTVNGTALSVYTTPASLLAVQFFRFNTLLTDASVHFVDLWADTPCN